MALLTLATALTGLVLAVLATVLVWSTLHLALNTHTSTHKETRS
ncbi:hypothetical protein ACFWZ7_14415 [Nocardiopsis alba]